MHLTTTAVRSRRAIASLAATLLLLAGCADDDASPPTTTAAPDAPPATTEPDGPVAPPALALEEVAQLDALTDLAAHPVTGELYVSERAGRVVRVDPASGEVLGEVVDLSDEVSTAVERGLLGLAIDGDGTHLYLSWNDEDGATRLTELPLGDDGVADAGGRRSLLEVEQPFPNHNGGDLAFGPDGMLYLGLGDGGAAGDPLGSGQDTSTLLGSLLRIDPAAGDGERPYGIPDGNPYADGDGDARAEIWLHGVRNPWRFSWDRATGDLWIADVGQGEWEELDRLPAPDAGRGANLGWNEMEGLVPFEDGTEPADAVAPVHVYGHDDGACSVTGGVVYRGSAIAGLAGTYLFGDFCVGDLLGLPIDATPDTPAIDLGVEVGAGTLVGFGEDLDGEVYVLTLAGTLYRIVEA